MKKINKLLMLLFLAVPMLFSCERDLETEGISRTTTFATFQMTGDEVISLGPGATYTEPGIKALEGSTEVPVTTTIKFSPMVTATTTRAGALKVDASSVDTSKPGLYTISYSATNSDGFPSSTERLVFVFAANPDPNVNLAGSYKSGSSPSSVVSKAADGVFFATNIWGGGSTVRISAYIMTADGLTLSVPYQEAQDDIYGYGTRGATGNLDMFMSRPLFPDQSLYKVSKIWVKQ